LPRPELAADYEVSGPGRHLLVKFDAADRLDHRLGRAGFRRFHWIQFSISAPEPTSSVRPLPPPAVWARNRQGCASLLVVLAVGESWPVAPARRALARRTKALRARCQSAYQLLDLMHQGPVLSESARSLLSTCAPCAQRYFPQTYPSSKLVCPVLDLDRSWFVSNVKQLVSKDEKSITKLGSELYVALWRGDNRSE
jgi:hypothetical protein